MEIFETLVISAGAAVIIGVFFFWKSPMMRYARTSNNGRPTAYWWVSFCTAIVVGAFIANHY